MGKKHHPEKRPTRSFPEAMSKKGRSVPTAAQLNDVMQVSGDKTAKIGSRKRKTFASVPIAGTISAGWGDPAEPADLGEIPVDLHALNIQPSSRTFALRVRGDSMIGALIADGDLVIVEAREPKIGDIVAALIDGETTLKRFVTLDGSLFLRAENPRYPDLIPMHELTVQGVVRAVVRVCDRSRPML